MPNSIPHLASAALVLFSTLNGPARAANNQFTPATQLRRPIAIAIHGQRAYVANRASGTLTTIDLESNTVVDETKVGQHLSSVAILPKSDHLLLLDEQTHQLLLAKPATTGLQIIQRLKVPHTPVELAVSRDGRRCAVASLWSHRVTFIDVNLLKPEAPAKERHNRPLRINKTIDLPFAPRMLRFLNNHAQLVVADAFGGRLAVIDTATGQLKTPTTINGHNIRGLAIAHGGQDLHVTHQTLDGNSTTTHEHVFWGGVMKNFVRSIPLHQLFATTNANHPLNGSTYPLGHPSGATGDPGPILVTRKGESALLLSGVNEVALRRRPREPFVRRKVGRRPSANALSTDEKTLYVANRFDDSISIIDFTTLKVTGTISLGPQPQLTAAQRGEQLFFDARLSLDGWYSCHSCHTDGHTNGLLNDNFGDNYFGDPKRIPSLLGVGKTHPWAWNGKTASLEEQINKSITSTMQGEKPTPRTVNDLAAYLKTLQPPPGIAAARGNSHRELIAAGRNLFRKLNCSSCHATPTYSSDAVYDVGLKDKSGNSQFNPPSLLGVSQRASFFHDGRAASLRDVLTTHQHNLDSPLGKSELRQLLEFLRSL